MNERLRLDIWQRSYGRCVVCGAPGTEIDHIVAKQMGGRKGAWKKWINRPDNLRLLCHTCHENKPFEKEG